jgi:hypothetical protein
LTERQLRITEATDSADRGALLPNGTLWSHAVVPGTYFRGGEFTIGEKELTSFVKNFEKGYPSKVPVDYEHTSTNGATTMGPQAKAGTAVEMHAVLTAADITPEIQAAVDRTEAEWKSLGITRKVNPLGLWVRWAPTPRAHEMLKAREYTEMSIAFNDVHPNNVTGENQGPTLLAIALTNRPFIDSMASIAASASTTERTPMVKFFSLLSANRGKPVTNEDEAATELNALTDKVKTTEAQLATATQFVDVVAAEFGGEKDASKVLAKIRELTSTNATLAARAEKADDGRIAAVVEGVMLANEKKLTKPARAMYATQLTANLKAGQELGKTDTEKVLSSLPQLSGTTQSTAADEGKGLTADAQLSARVVEISEKHPAISKMTDPNARALAALTEAKRELTTADGK